MEQTGKYNTADVERMFLKHLDYVPTFKAGELHVVAHMLGVAYAQGQRDAKPSKAKKL